MGLGRRLLKSFGGVGFDSVFFFLFLRTGQHQGVLCVCACVSKLPVLPHPAVFGVSREWEERESCFIHFSLFLRIARTAFVSTPAPMSALFDFNAFLSVVLLTICTCTYVKMRAPAVLSERTGCVVMGRHRVFFVRHAPARFLLSSVWARLSSLTRLQRVRCLLMGRNAEKRHTLLVHNTHTHLFVPSSFPPSHQVPGPVLEGGADRCVCGWVCMLAVSVFFFSDSPTHHPSPPHPSPGERLSPWVAVSCIAMAFTTLFS